VIVRLDEPRDRASALLVERAAFGGSVEAAIVEAVRDEPGSFALVAEDDGVIVGHVQLSRAWVDEEPVLALGPIGVLPERQGRRIGSSLVGAAVEEAAARGAPAVILLGAPGYYGRLGFEPASRHGLANPFAGETDEGFTIEEGDFQIAVLDEDRARRLAGNVRWHPAFG
jgi:predicted N-acetyltransferase YhbS